jgi:hypothetical protein
MPSFTTTTAIYSATSAIMMMGAMKAYFYRFGLMCGIPKVTLEGEKSDWEDILHRLERLKKYGVQTIAWYHHLRPTISRFVSAYDDPTSPNNLDFWNKVAHFGGGRSGPTWLSGWITAFCVFNEGGNTFNANTEDAKDPVHLSTSQFASAYLPQRLNQILHWTTSHINSRQVPCGYTHA